LGDATARGGFALDEAQRAVIHESRDFHLAVLQALRSPSFQTAGRLVINPFLAALRADRGFHAPYDHDTAAHVRRKGGLPSRFVFAAEGAWIIFCGDDFQSPAQGRTVVEPASSLQQRLSSVFIHPRLQLLR
jgi:hypothetical protein